MLFMAGVLNIGLFCFRGKTMNRMMITGISFDYGRRPAGGLISTAHFSEKGWFYLTFRRALAMEMC